VYERSERPHYKGFSKGDNSGEDQGRKWIILLLRRLLLLVG
jgi:hypothetical protein